MSRKLKLLIILSIFSFFIFGINTSTADEKIQNYIISSGSFGGNYNKTGIVVAELLNEIDENTAFSSLVMVDTLCWSKEVRFFTIAHKLFLTLFFYSRGLNVRQIIFG